MRRLLILLYALIFVDEVALVSLVPLLPSYRDAFDLSGFESGVALSAASLAIVAGAIPGGVAGDRLGHRRVTLAAGLLLAASCLGQGLAVGLWTLVAARLAFGVSSAVIWSAGLSWLSDSAGEDRPGAVGAVIAVAGLGGMVGPGLRRRPGRPGRPRRPLSDPGRRRAGAGRGARLRRPWQRGPPRAAAAADRRASAWPAATR